MRIVWRFNNFDKNPQESSKILISLFGKRCSLTSSGRHDQTEKDRALWIFSTIQQRTNLNLQKSRFCYINILFYGKNSKKGMLLNWTPCSIGSSWSCSFVMDNTWLFLKFILVKQGWCESFPDNIYNYSNHIFTGNIYKIDWHEQWLTHTSCENG